MIGMQQKPYSVSLLTFMTNPISILRPTGHIFPLVQSLKDIHHFDIETQIQYYAPLAIERTLTDEGAIIEEDQVKAFVNSADWNLGE